MTRMVITLLKTCKWANPEKMANFGFLMIKLGKNTGSFNISALKY